MDYFQPLTINDRLNINRLLQESFYYDGYTSSELVFENMFVWNFQNSIEIAWIEDGMAVIRSREQGGVWIFFPPICRNQDEFVRGMEYIKKNFPNNLVGGLSHHMVETCQNRDYLILYDDYYSEYIYDPKELAQMKGGKFSRKRNLVAQFKKKYSYELVSYSSAYLEGVKEFLNRYQNEGGADEDFSAIMFALKNQAVLNLNCDLLIVEGLIVGLSVGVISIFNHAVILFEKNDYNYVGSGAILVQLTATKHYAGLNSLTRQEDLGLPQLRKAKLSLNPVAKERKYSCFFDADTKGLYGLYRKSFDDSSDYVDFFFLHSYNPNHSYFVKRDNTIVSSLHIIMKKMMFRDHIIDLPFVVAASTDFNYRRQGLMREVMSKTFADLLRQGYYLAALYPVDPNFYLDYGFVHYSYGLKLENIKNTFKCNIEQTNDSETLSKMYNHCIAGKDGYIVRDERYYDQYLNSLWQDKVVFDLLKKDGETFGYVAHKDGDVDEILLCGEQRPTHSDIDFSQVVMPHHEGNIPTNMMRILDVRKLLEIIQVSKNTTLDLNIRVTDKFIKENNITINLTIVNGRIKTKYTETFDIEISIEELTNVLFLGQGDQRLSVLFPLKKMVCFDKF